VWGFRGVSPREEPANEQPAGGELSARSFLGGYALTLRKGERGEDSRPPRSRLASSPVAFCAHHEAERSERRAMRNPPSPSERRDDGGRQAARSAVLRFLPGRSCLYLEYPFQVSAEAVSNLSVITLVESEGEPQQRNFSTWANKTYVQYGRGMILPDLFF
jgi:hypothetical protein